MYELRDLPGVDALIQDESLEVALSRFGPAAVKQAIRDIQNDIRESKKVPEWSINPSGYLSPIFQALDSQTYRIIFNLTGTIIHSNLGREYSTGMCTCLYPGAPLNLVLSIRIPGTRRTSKSISFS